MDMTDRIFTAVFTKLFCIHEAPVFGVIWPTISYIITLRQIPRKFRHQWCRHIDSFQGLTKMPSVPNYLSIDFTLYLMYFVFHYVHCALAFACFVYCCQFCQAPGKQHISSTAHYHFLGVNILLTVDRTISFISQLDTCKTLYWKLQYRRDSKFWSGPRWQSGWVSLQQASLYSMSTNA